MLQTVDCWSFSLRDAMHKRGLCRRTMFVWLPSRSCIVSKRLKMRP